MKIRNKKILLLVGMFGAAVLFTGCFRRDTNRLQPTDGFSGSGTGSNSGSADVQEETMTVTETETEAGISFPCELDNGSLTVNSLFQSSIENPDCSNEYGDNIASLELVNQSGRFLESAGITLHMSDGRDLNMVVNDVPDGQKVWVFDSQNSSIADRAVCLSIDCTANYLDETPLMADQLTVAAAGTTVTLTNQSEETLSGLTVRCHCLFDGIYYGGLTYSYPVEELPPGTSTVIEAGDCFLGTADVVRIIK